MPEQPVASSPVYAAHPTVHVDSQESERASALLIGMEMTESEGGMSAMELKFSNVAGDNGAAADLAFEDESILKLGAKIAVYCGDVTSPQEVFQGTVTGIEADFPEGSAPELVVLAEDVFQRARMARRTKLYENATVADLAQQVASRLNLTPQVTGLSENIGVQMQLNESDLAFLRRILRRYDGDMQVVGTELHVSPRSDVQRGALDLELHSQLRHARVLADLSHQITKVTVAGWDAQQGARVVGNSTGANTAPGTGRTGATVLQDAIGARAEHIGHVAVTTSDEAQALADAAFDSRARRFVCVHGTAEGNPAIRVGTNVTLSGMSSRFNNTYYVVRARHRYDLSRGYETDFEAESAFLGAV
jgi:phage protein D